MKFREMIPVGWSKGDLFDPDSRFSSLYKEMNRFFEDFSHSMRGFAPAHPGWWSQYTGVMPHADVFEDENSVEVTAELPGMEEKDIDIRMSNNMLTIKGEKKSERELKGKDHYRRERTYGSFHRSIHIPFDIEMDKIEASFKNGVLTVKLPKNPTTKEGGTKIPIKS